MTGLRVTHVGGPTVLIEFGGWRILTDPTFDPPGRRYVFGWGTSSRKLAGPAVGADALGSIDAVLLTHDHHGDNLDDAGRALLPSAGSVLTTVAGAGRLGGNAAGLAPWSSTRLLHPDRPSIEVTATPARHGPPFSGRSWATWSASRCVGTASATARCGSPATPCCTAGSARSPTGYGSAWPCCTWAASGSR
ncbi:hypothetical protein BJF90_22180 [Pseudonocardia sp. CNS-004]|nr:hypothetical protein BJF90_22180 [Pseudonocardia sp. CNS-004]